MDEPIVVFEDEHILILNKPSGWITNEADTAKNQPVVQTWVREHLGKKKDKTAERDSFSARDGVVHRLDKETSGVLIIAKTPDAFTNLQGQFKNRKVKKAYTALVHGVVEPDKGIIDAPVGRLPWRKDRFGVLPGGRNATTRYEVNSRYTDERGSVYELVDLYPKTGRTHQIRIHMKHIGHPLVSDEFYAGRKRSRDDRAWCPRLFLHAASIQFAHPASGEEVSYKADLSEDLSSAIVKLRKVT